MSSDGEVVLTIPIAIFTIAIVCFTVYIVKWLNKKTSEIKKEPTKSKEQSQSSHPKNDPKKKKMAPTQKSHGSPPVKFDHPHLITTLKGHTNSLTGGDFSPSGKHFITASQVSRDAREEEEKSEENNIFLGCNYEEEWITRSDVTPSDTEASVTSSSSGGSKMSKRQRKNKKRKKRPLEIISPPEAPKDMHVMKIKNNSKPNLEKFSPKFFYEKIGLSLRSLHKYLLPMCVSVTDRIISGYPYETKKGVYVFKAYPYSRVETILADQTLVSEETKDMKFSSDNDEELLQSSSSSDGGTYSPSYMPMEDKNFKKCNRCKQQFNLLLNIAGMGLYYCYYHTSKGDINRQTGTVYFSCCGGTSTDRGCEVSPCHVYHHLQLGLNGPLQGYRSTRPFSRESYIHGLDCEMVFTDLGFEVGRATLVSIDGKAVFDQYIRPEGNVYDYNTKFSGLTPECFYNAISFQEAQTKLLNLISSFDILVGHSLEGDLAVLKIVHRRVVDSSLLYQITNNRPNYGTGSPLPRRQGLKFLVSKYLGENIQGNDGHSSYEDALAALKLVLLKVSEETDSKAKGPKVAPTPAAC